jgi:two-component system chemotaxis response regulator CheB
MEESKLKGKALVIGGSAGALVTVLQLVQSFRRDVELAVLVVLHRKQQEENILLEVLRTRTDFKVYEAEDKDEMKPGVIYVAPSDYHVLIEKDHTITLDDSEKVNYSRPSIDVSFESAADVYGTSLTCVLLSGANADGVDGLINARARGAKIVIQDPKSAEFDYMPQQAMKVIKPDFLLTHENIGEFYEMLRS